MDPELFWFPARHYCLSHSVGAQPKAYKDAINAGYETPWRTSGAEVWDDWFAIAEKFKTGLAPILGVEPADICPQTNISSGVAKLLFSLPARPGRNKIVLSEDDFPTVGFALAQGQRNGYELIFLPGGDALADPDHWARAFEDDVQLICAMGVYSNSSVRAPLAQIAARARESGAFTMFDVAQAAGAIPLALEEWGCDFALGTSQKYLCGGSGAAYLWVRGETAQACNPIDVGWFSHASPYEFDIHNFEYADGAARFTGGTPSFGPLAGALPGQDIIRGCGVSAIEAHVQDLLTKLFARLPEDAILSMRQRELRGASAVVKVRDLAAAQKRLREQDIGHDQRLGGIRFSFHLYNDDRDVDALADTLGDLV